MARHNTVLLYSFVPHFIQGETPSGEYLVRHEDGHLEMIFWIHYKGHRDPIIIGMTEETFERGRLSESDFVACARGLRQQMRRQEDVHGYNLPRYQEVLIRPIRAKLNQAWGLGRAYIILRVPLINPDSNKECFYAWMHDRLNWDTVREEGALHP
ncbi:MAG: hypothetical protein ACAH35_00485 [Candidatus Paceibacterota bacterium]